VVLAGELNALSLRLAQATISIKFLLE
jgi:hypothetical protein